MNTLLPRSSFCYRISRTPVEEAENSLTTIISKNELNLNGICFAVINHTTSIFIMGVRGSRKAWICVDFLSGFSFLLSGTLRSMTIKRHGHLCPTRVTSSQLAKTPATYIHWTATARLAVDTTFTMETSISHNLWGT